MKKQSSTNTFLIAIVVGAIAGALAAMVVVNNQEAAEDTTEDLIQDFYEVENAVHVSPHGLRKHMGEDDAPLLVDLRSNEEYLEEHIIGAVNIPAYKDRDNSDYGAVERIVTSFKELQDNNPGRDIIVYCYSIPCMTGRKVGKMLTDHGIYVKHLGIGWNEWRYFWTLWNHPHEWEITNVEDYLASGPEPGIFEKDLTGAGCPIEGEFGC
jgi:rhodanese-related sulfurtransferase